MSIYALGDRRPSFGEGSWIAHNATVVGSVQAGRNVSVWYNVVMRGDTVLCEGTETRAFCIKHPDDPTRIKAIPVPEDIKALCS